MTAQEQAFVRVCIALAGAIRNLGSVPNGELYARTMNHLNIQTYTSVLEVLKKSKLVEEKNHLLTWIGPKKEQA